MAIKGKKRTKSRTARAVAAPPRPFLVPPKTPLFRRTGTKVVLVVLIEALIFGALVIAGAESDDDAYRAEVTEFGSLVETALYGSGAAQPLPTGPLILPELGQLISQLETGDEVKEKDALTNAESWSSVTERAANTIESIEADDLQLLEARNLMEQGLRIYSGVASDARVALQLEGDTRQQLVESLTGQYQAAAEVFDSGFGKLQEERRRAEIPLEQPPIPGPQDLPGGIPGLPGG